MKCYLRTCCILVTFYNLIKVPSSHIHSWMIILGFYFDGLPNLCTLSMNQEEGMEVHSKQKHRRAVSVQKNSEAKKLVLSQKYSFKWHLLFIRCLWLFCNLVIMMPWVRRRDVRAGSPLMGLKLGQSVAYFHIRCSAQVPENTNSFYILQRVSSGFSIRVCLFLLLICSRQNDFLPCYMTINPRSKFATQWLLFHFPNLQVIFEKTCFRCSVSQ